MRSRDRETATSGDGVHRPGFTILELMIVMALFSFVLAAASFGLARLWRAQSSLQLDLARSSTVMRLARQLRIDAHSAEAATMQRADDNQASLVFQFQSIPSDLIATVSDPQQTGSDSPLDAAKFGLAQFPTRVEYRREQAGIIRSSYHDEIIVHRDVFQLDDWVETSWTQPSEALFHLRITYTDPLRPDDLTQPSEEFQFSIGFTSRGNP